MAGSTGPTLPGGRAMVRDQLDDVSVTLDGRMAYVERDQSLRRDGRSVAGGLCDVTDNLQ